MKNNILNVLIVILLTAIGIVSYLLYNRQKSDDERIIISVNDIILLVGEEYSIEVTINSKNERNQTLTWTSSDSSIATVDSTGKVIAKAKGEVDIKVKTSNGLEATCHVKINNKVIAVTGIKLDKTNLTLEKGDTGILKATITPSDASDKTLTWSSSNNSIATVDSTGKVTAKAKGEVDIKVKTSNGLEATCHVKVNDSSIPIKSISLDNTSLNITYGSSQTIKATVSPSNTTEKLSWSSSNSKVVKVDKNGMVNAVGKGTATVTAKSPGGKKATCTITVNHYIKEDDYPYIYRDESAELTIEKKLYNSTLTGKKTNYYQMHLVLTDYSRLHTGLTYNKKMLMENIWPKEFPKLPKK